MTLDFNIPGKLKVDMCNYVKQMVEELKPEERGKSNGSCPWNDKLLHTRPSGFIVLLPKVCSLQKEQGRISIQPSHSFVPKFKLHPMKIGASSNE